MHLSDSPCQDTPTSFSPLNFFYKLYKLNIPLPYLPLTRPEPGPRFRGIAIIKVASLPFLLQSFACVSCVGGRGMGKGGRGRNAGAVPMGGVSYWGAVLVRLTQRPLFHFVTFFIKRRRYFFFLAFFLYYRSPSGGASASESWIYVLAFIGFSCCCCCLIAPASVAKCVIDARAC